MKRPPWNPRPYPCAVSGISAIVVSATISKDAVREAFLVAPKDERTGSISVPFVVSGIAAIVGFATTFEDEVREAYL